MSDQRKPPLCDQHPWNHIRHRCCCVFDYDSDDDGPLAECCYHATLRAERDEAVRRAGEMESRYDRLTVDYAKRCAERDEARTEAGAWEAKRDWYKHPKAQLEIGLKARLRLELRHIEEIVRGTPRDDLGVDDDYWSTLCDDALKLRAERDEAVALLREESHEHYRFTQMTEYPSVTRMLLWNMDRKRRIDAFLAKEKP